MSDIASGLAREHMTDFQLSRTTLQRELDRALEDDAAFESWLQRHVPEFDKADVLHAREMFLERTWRPINETFPEPKIHESEGWPFVTIHLGGVA
jgi:hypothetical protein